MAIRDACASIGSCRLGGCVLAVTLEPCTMFAGAILHARLAGIVYGCEDRLAGAVASRADVLDQGLAGRLAWHMGGVLARDCAGLLEAFFAARRG
jgi:tRNA(adenine34) deaminase